MNNQIETGGYYAGDCTADRYSIFLSVIMWGSLWGIFEATVGYLLHVVSFGYSWLIWYPVACFFLSCQYRAAGKISSLIFTGFLCASIKMLNLLLPGRIDKVINPAISIVFEALAIAAIMYAVKLVFKENRKRPYIKALTVFCINTGWRLMFILYLLVLVPGWIRDVSVISSPQKFIPFFVTQNLLTSVIIYLGYQFESYLFKPFDKLGESLFKWRMKLSERKLRALGTGAAALLLIVNVALTMLLK